MESTSELAVRTVGEIVAEDFRRARVLKQYGIEFCCGGGIALQEACRRNDLSLEEVTGALLSVEREPAGALADVARWSPTFLADYIENVHHSYVRSAIPALRAFTTKVARVHGGAVPQLVQIADAFAELADELEAHMDYEEAEIFPRIRTHNPDVAELLGRAETEHVRAGELMATIRSLSDDFTPPDWACATYRASFVNLQEFEEDLHKHVHLENNVLFRRIQAPTA